MVFISFHGYELIEQITDSVVLCVCTCDRLFCSHVSAHRSSTWKMFCLLLTFHPWPWLHVQTSCHGWNRYGHAGLLGMSLCLHDHHDLSGVDGNLVEGQRQGLDARSWGLMLSVWMRGSRPELCCLHRGGMRSGGRGGWFSGGFPHVVW